MFYYTIKIIRINILLYNIEKIICFVKKLYESP